MNKWRNRSPFDDSVGPRKPLGHLWITLNIIKNSFSWFLELYIGPIVINLCLPQLVWYSTTVSQSIAFDHTTKIEDFVIARGQLTPIWPVVTPWFIASSLESIECEATVLPHNIPMLSTQCYHIITLINIVYTDDESFIKPLMYPFIHQ